MSLKVPIILEHEECILHSRKVVKFVDKLYKPNKQLENPTELCTNFPLTLDEKMQKTVSENFRVSNIYLGCAVAEGENVFLIHNGEFYLPLVAKYNPNRTYYECEQKQNSEEFFTQLFGSLEIQQTIESYQKIKYGENSAHTFSVPRVFGNVTIECSKLGRLSFFLMERCSASVFDEFSTKLNLKKILSILDLYASSIKFLEFIHTNCEVAFVDIKSENLSRRKLGHSETGAVFYDYGSCSIFGNKEERVKWKKAMGLHPYIECGTPFSKSPDVELGGELLIIL